MHNRDAGHDSQELFKAAIGALNYARERMDMSTVNYPARKEVVPLQPPNSNACGCFALYNMACVLQDVADDRTPMHKGKWFW